MTRDEILNAIDAAYDCDDPKTAASLESKLRVTPNVTSVTPDVTSPYAGAALTPDGLIDTKSLFAQGESK